LARACDSPDGSAFGVACSDDAFGALTSVLGMVRTTRDPKTGDLTFSQSIDFRYPTCTTSSEIEQAVREAVASCGASFAMGHDKEPFTMGADSPAIEALLSAYNQVTGESAQPFTMKGGTYARMFSRAASFGPEKPWESKPDWAGSMHGPDEAIAEDLLKEAFVVYAVAIGKLMEVQL
ncbi:MAG: M20/M25/M40 family metallo-hydrolase, partial [Eggerthellaceae bacterium]|nr:M20/M25/M40 family metallo-hydrolase [Eggerthellaceae bacterium]